MSRVTASHTPASSFETVVVVDGEGSESMKRYQELLASHTVVIKEGSLSETYDRILENKRPTLEGRDLRILTLTEESTDGEVEEITAWFKTKVVADATLNGKVKLNLSIIKGKMEIQDRVRLMGRLIEELEKAEAVKSPAPFSSMDIRIPVLNMNDFYDETRREAFIRDLRKAATTVGFFAVQNAGIERSVIGNAYKQSEDFFKKDADFKMQSFVAELGGQRGFVPGESAKGVAVKDTKQFYHIGNERSPVKNIWPNQPGFEEEVSLLYRELERYVGPLQEAIVAAINLNAQEKIPSSYLNDTTKNGENLLRALYYPAATKEQLSDPTKPHFWGAAHTDIDYFTILPYATEKGLQLKLNGEWLNVVVPPDSFIVNIGDMLENLTNGLFKSAEHRIVALEPDMERFSMVFFIHPEGSTPLEPLSSCVEQTGGKQLYAKGTRDEFLFERLLELGIAPGLLELYYNTRHAERQMEYGRASPQVLEMFREKGFSFPKSQ